MVSEAKEKGKGLQYLVSACLAGFPCRYDGGSSPDPKVCDLVVQGEALPVCPEQLGGLPTPRPPAELQAGAEEGAVRVCNAAGEDVTAAFRQGAEAVACLARRFGVRRAILKEKSPSCGVNWVYDGSFQGRLVRGRGLAAQALAAAGVEVKSNEEK